MVGTIGFAGSRARSRGRLGQWVLRLGGPHTIAAALGGSALGALVAFAGSVVVSGAFDAGPGVVAAALGALALADVAGLPPQYTTRARQVPLSWKHLLPAPTSSALYGLVLGLGVGTTVYFWSYPALVVATFFSGNVFTGIAAGAAFGVGRALPVLASPLTPDVERLEEAVDSIRHVVGRVRNLPLRVASAGATASLAAIILW
ncbi:MAG TPA: hypothetical protein VG318_12060 [Actinomycetota bacterium]|nr:hypothetical protein [Actinomycetota bacterium]